MVDASIRELQIPSEAENIDEVSDGRGMNNDPGATGRAGGTRALVLASLSADTLDISESSFRDLSGSEGGEVHTVKGMWEGGGVWGKVLNRVMNVPGILLEC